MTRQNRKISKAISKARTEYVSDEIKREQDNQFHHRCSGCNKTIGKKAYDLKGICNSCYIADNRENVRRKHKKSKTTKMSRARNNKTTYMFF